MKARLQVKAQSELVAVGDGRSTLLPSRADTAVALKERGHLQELSRGIGRAPAAALQGRFIVEQKHINIEIPVAAMQMLIEIMQQMAQGKPVSIIPANAELTTQQAADFLNISRPYFVKLLEEGELPFRKIGTRRRVQFKDLVEFNVKDIGRRNKVSDELSKLSQEIASDLGEDY